jgi:hypothetical protein
MQKMRVECRLHLQRQGVQLTLGRDPSVKSVALKAKVGMCGADPNNAVKRFQRGGVITLDGALMGYALDGDVWSSSTDVNLDNAF